jgi:hypothetical protein
MEVRATAANEYPWPEYTMIFEQPMAAVAILRLCEQSLQAARHLLADEEASSVPPGALLDLDAALHHLRQALAQMPALTPRTGG